MPSQNYWPPSSRGWSDHLAEPSYVANVAERINDAWLPGCRCCSQWGTQLTMSPATLASYRSVSGGLAPDLFDPQVRCRGHQRVAGSRFHLVRLASGVFAYTAFAIDAFA